jgi:hypothetical protein
MQASARQAVWLAPRSPEELTAPLGGTRSKRMTAKRDLQTLLDATQPNPKGALHE